ncbi:hypothetical protein [Actinomadura sp. SCN-SB]|uniref:hypothetical protein n=1 Tax=Actinomadura sp. SCN-SB TaxID=3373092 RepID=UPI003752D865
MAFDRKDPSRPPVDHPDKPDAKDADPQAGGVGVKDDPGSPSQPSRLASKRYASLSAEERRELDDKNAGSRPEPTGRGRTERAEESTSDSQRSGWRPPPDDPGSPGRPSRLESREIAANAWRRRPEAIEPVQLAEANGERKQPQPEQAPQEAGGDQEFDEGSDRLAVEAHDDKGDQNAADPGDESPADTERTRDNDASAVPVGERTEPSPGDDGNGTDLPAPAQDAPPAGPFEDPDPGRRSTEAPERSEVPPEREGNARAPESEARDGAESTGTGDGQDVGARLPTSIVGTRPGGGLLRGGDTFAVRPGDPVPDVGERGRGLERVDPGDTVEGRGEIPSDLEEEKDLREPDPDHARRRARMKDKLRRKGQDGLDVVRKGGNKADDLLKSPKGDDLRASTVRDSGHMEPPPDKPLKGGDLIVGFVAFGAVTAYALRRLREKVGGSER